MTTPKTYAREYYRQQLAINSPQTYQKILNREKAKDNQEVIFQRYKDGTTLKLLAQEYQVSDFFLRKLIKSQRLVNGEAIPDKSTENKLKYDSRKKAELEHERIKEAHNKGISLAKLSREYGVSSFVIKKLLISTNNTIKNVESVTISSNTDLQCL